MSTSWRPATKHQETQHTLTHPPAELTLRLNLKPRRAPSVTCTVQVYMETDKFVKIVTGTLVRVGLVVNGQRTFLVAYCVGAVSK